MNEHHFTLVASKTLPLTLDLAREFRDLDPSPTERQLNDSRVKHLRSKLENGQFVPVNWSIAKRGDRRVRMNGMHSSTMLAEWDGPFPENLRAHIDEYEVSSNEGLALLFRQFDDRKSGRSPLDVSGAYQGLQENLRSLARPIAKLGIDGAVWYRRNVEGLPVPVGDDAYSLFGETGLHAFLLWLAEVLKGRTAELKLIPVVAAMYGTYITSAVASRFWEDVARGGAEFEETHPTTILDNWLKMLKSKRNLDIRPANYYQGCVFAWNAFCTGATMIAIKSDVRKGLLKIAE